MDEIREQTPPAPLRVPAVAQARGPFMLLVGVAVVGGSLGGLVGAAFRFVLGRCEILRTHLLAQLQTHPSWGWAATMSGGALTAALARWLVGRLAPDAEGSGIPAVEGIVRREDPVDPLIILPVKFVAGAAAIGGGLALGREGPTVRMGSIIAGTLGRWLRFGPEDVRVLVAAGAGAGLAAAFGAPLAGALFVLEEVEQRFDFRVASASFGATAASMAVVQLLFGSTPELAMGTIVAPPLVSLPLFALFGVLAGAAGVLYNRLIVGGLDLSERLARISPEWRAAAIGAGVGLVAWFRPDLAGNGDVLLLGLLHGAFPLAAVGLILLIRFVIGPASYAARTPGGLFWPLLVVGAALGNAFGRLSVHWFPVLAPDPLSFTVVGMAAFFAAIVGAPLTGAALIVEMASAHALLVPMLAAFTTAVTVPLLLRSAPIYEALYERRRSRRAPVNAGSRRD